GTSAGGSMLWSDPVTEKPVLGTTEVWKIINNTGDAHPVHQHLVQFRILERQAFDTASYVPGEPSTLTLIGAPMLPNPEEAGWKDTVKAAPGEVVRIIANYDLPGEYVWHCHILEHEDHEMMRPFIVVN
ncbi:MAG: multicopper oxidase domain-containing protein, partial [Gammaproteobacteria bacterium]|nr:multicopper oxidase domain-containing protein [Gammaproteobacteria bacterium]